MFERFTWKLRATFLGNHAEARAERAAESQSAPRIEEAASPTRAHPSLVYHAQNTPKMPISTEVDCTLSTHHKSRT